MQKVNKMRLGGRTCPIKLTILVALLGLTACARSTTSYVHPDVDLSFIRRVAIVPYENMSQDAYADERLRSLFLMRILREGSLEVVEPGAVTDAMIRLRFPTGSTLSPEQYVALGKELGVDGIFTGSVQEYGVAREAREQMSRVTVVFGLVETQTGITVWQSEVHLNGSSFLRRLFGGGTRSMHDVSRSAVNRALRSLF